MDQLNIRVTDANAFYFDTEAEFSIRWHSRFCVELTLRSWELDQLIDAWQQAEQREAAELYQAQVERVEEQATQLVEDLKALSVISQFRQIACRVIVPVVQEGWSRFKKRRRCHE